MAILFKLSRDGNNYYAAPFGKPRFLVGKRTTYQDNVGLYNLAKAAGAIYQPEDYVAQYGNWAHFIAPTVACESNGSFFCLNTYDRAKFTFGFMQYAAHVPNGDFVQFFRRLLAQPEALEYFPDLQVINNRIFLYRNGQVIQLENNQTTQPLMDYFNPSLNEVEDAELLNSARLIHWATESAAHRDLQVAVAVEQARSNLRLYHRRYNLDQAPDRICLAICDIRHQGRARSEQIIQALNTGGNYDRAFVNLLALGKEHYPTRVNTLRNEITRLTGTGLMGAMVYNPSRGDFEA
jgi:hypothetical protein